MVFSANFILPLFLVPLVFAHPFRRSADANSELQDLFTGNQRFREEIEVENPGLLKKLALEGQAPPFMFLGCSDSRTSEGTIFDAKPGTLFTERNIANQYHQSDPNANSVLSYAVSHLHVKHIVVMGHYGCGGVAAAIVPPPTPPIDAATAAVQSWIAPIRGIYASSNRSEIIALRTKNTSLKEVPVPELHDPGFRALIEENVKASVQHIASTVIITEQYASASAPTSPQDTFIHGWVYDIETGQIYNLNVSVGPPGKDVPSVPFSVVGY